MIGLLVRIYTEKLDSNESIKLAFGKEKYEVYLAPGQGLYLNTMKFYENKHNNSIQN